RLVVVSRRAQRAGLGCRRHNQVARGSMATHGDDDRTIDALRAQSSDGLAPSGRVEYRLDQQLYKSAATLPEARAQGKALQRQRSASHDEITRDGNCLVLEMASPDRAGDGVRAHDHPGA